MRVREVGPISRCHAAVTPARRSAATANWLKLRAFGLTQYDAVLLVDSNAYIGGDISPLFNLPTDFAAGWDQVRYGWGFVEGGLRKRLVCVPRVCSERPAGGALMPAHSWTECSA